MGRNKNLLLPTGVIPNFNIDNNILILNNSPRLKKKKSEQLIDKCSGLVHNKRWMSGKFFSKKMEFTKMTENH